jgi:hypothetical protein
MRRERDGDTIPADQEFYNKGLFSSAKPQKTKYQELINIKKSNFIPNLLFYEFYFLYL